ncbi:MAG TPA: hypothetical protein VLG50_03720 [Candidatus Saccharimonadales bacterium]|nr:hypothetical protein [Candidatus Saccharimonadales bacterium]
MHKIVILKANKQKMVATEYKDGKYLCAKINPNNGTYRANAKFYWFSEIKLEILN